MFDEDFRKIIVFTCIFGILGLLIITYYFECVEITVSDLFVGNPKESIYIVSGQVKSIEIKSNTLFFTFCDLENCISAVYFNPKARAIDSLKATQLDNSSIKIKGRFERYYGVAEIIVYKIYFDNDNLDYS